MTDHDAPPTSGHESASEHLLKDGTNPEYQRSTLVDQEFLRGVLCHVEVDRTRELLSVLRKNDSPSQD